MLIDLLQKGMIDNVVTQRKLQRTIFPFFVVTLHPGINSLSPQFIHEDIEDNSKE